MNSIKLNVAILQHSDQTPPGSCGEWIEMKGHQAKVYLLHRGDALPDLAATDLLIILGGPMNVDDLKAHPWLAAEKSLIKNAVADGKTCLGLCLGAQFLAQALGGKVEPNKHWEVGWKSVQIVGRDQPLKVFQLHQDHFGLPPGAERLATNEITENQAFRYGDHVVGTQFHPESSEDWVQGYALEKARKLKGPYVAPPETISEGLSHLPEMKAWFFELLTQLEDRTYKNLRKSLS
jgi:GMP synthase-like glutamine amidotransferase